MDLNNLTLLIVGIVLVVCSLILAAVTWKQSHKTKDLEHRVKILEASKVTRNPHLTNSGIEDAIAILRNLKEEQEESTARQAYINKRIEQAEGILKQIRSDPSSYDEDQPNGKKVNLTR